MTLETKITDFKLRQAKIVAMHADLQAKLQRFGQDCESRMEAIKTEFEARKAEWSADLEKEKESYKADLKAVFGVTDGESANILDLVQLIVKVTSQQ
jgi:hypothetical protein